MRGLTAKYSTAQAYYYSKEITSLVQETRSSHWAHYRDIEYLIDEDEYLKRSYKLQEYKSKMSMFKEYYFYHEDCPRVFMPDIEVIYGKWQDRKRNFMYKKLKNLFDQDKDEKSIT